MKKNGEVEDTDHITNLAMGPGDGRDPEALWDTQSIKSKRKNPHILFKGDQTEGKSAAKGDIIKIEALKQKEVPATEKKMNKFKIPTTGLELRLRVVDEDLQPLSGCDYELKIDGNGKALKGTLDDTGIIEAKIKSGPAEKGLLKVWLKADEDEENDFDDDADADDDGKLGQRIIFDLRIGKLNPILEEAPNIECVSGLQARLNNLGFDTGEVDGIRGNITKGAIKSFQKKFKLTENGQSDNATQNKIHEFHDTRTQAPPKKEEAAAKGPAKKASSKPPSKPLPKPPSTGSGNQQGGKGPSAKAPSRPAPKPPVQAPDYEAPKPPPQAPAGEAPKPPPQAPTREAPKPPTQQAPKAPGAGGAAAPSPKRPPKPPPKPPRR